MIWRPSGVQASVNGRACPLGSSVPTLTRADSAPGAPVRARSTSMIEMLLPSKSACPLSRAGHRDEFAVRARLDAEGAGLHWNARRNLYDRNAHQRLPQIHHGHVI